MFTNPIVRIMDLSHNNLGPQTAIEFGFGLLHNKHLRKLNLSYTDLTNDGNEQKGVQELFDFININRTLQSLNLSNNNISSQSCGVLREIMAANFTSMKVGKGVNQDKFTNVSIGLHQLDIDLCFQLVVI